MEPATRASYLDGIRRAGKCCFETLPAGDNEGFYLRASVKRAQVLANVATDLQQRGDSLLLRLVAATLLFGDGVEHFQPVGNQPLFGFDEAFLRT